MAEQLFSQRYGVKLQVLGPHLQVLRLGLVQEPTGHQGVTDPSLGKAWREQEDTYKERGEKSEHCHRQTERGVRLSHFNTAAGDQSVRTN